MVKEIAEKQICSYFTKSEYKLMSKRKGALGIRHHSGYLRSLVLKDLNTTTTTNTTK